MKIRLIAAVAALTLSLSGCVIDAAALNSAAWYQPAPSYGYGYQPAPSYGYQPSLSYGNVYSGGRPHHARRLHGYH